jgi:hypothetical protein
VDTERRENLWENKEEWRKLCYKRKGVATDTRETLTEGYTRRKYFL